MLRDRIRFGQARGRHSQRIISTVERATSDGRYTPENGRYTPQSDRLLRCREMTLRATFCRTHPQQKQRAFSRSPTIILWQSRTGGGDVHRIRVPSGPQKLRKIILSGGRS
jgi:hypothetical protein